MKTEAETDDVATAQERPGPPEAGRGRKAFPLEPPEGAWSCQHFDFRLLASKTMRGYVSIVSCCQVCSNLLWQP